jgi:predicted Zn-dependent peptidase
MTPAINHLIDICRCSSEDLERERGPVLEEWRASRTAAGRAAEAHWKLMMRGSKFAERMPIGLESIIREASAETVKGFYRRWYQPQFMAVIAVGDFEVRVFFFLYSWTAVSVKSQLEAIMPSPTFTHNSLASCSALELSSWSGIWCFLRGGALESLVIW